MPTTTECKYPHLTYCQKYDVHCCCPKCTVSINNKCTQKGKNICSDCIGPPVKYLGKETAGTNLQCQHMIFFHRGWYKKKGRFLGDFK